MVVPHSSYARQGGGGAPSCMDKVKFGFLMGLSIGAAAGLLLGGFAVFRLVGGGSLFCCCCYLYASLFVYFSTPQLVGREKLAMLGKTIAGSGGSFGLFMAVGQGIRC